MKPIVPYTKTKLQSWFILGIRALNRDSFLFTFFSFQIEKKKKTYRQASSIIKRVWF